MYDILKTEVFSFSICLHAGTKLSSVRIISHRFEILFILVITVGGFRRTECDIGGQDFGANGWQFVFARRKPPPAPRHPPPVKRDSIATKNVRSTILFYSFHKAKKLGSFIFLSCFFKKYELAAL